MLQADPVKLKEDVEAALKLSRELLAEAERTDTDVTGTVSKERIDKGRVFFIFRFTDPPDQIFWKLKKK